MPSFCIGPVSAPPPDALLPRTISRAASTCIIWSIAPSACGATSDENFHTRPEPKSDSAAITCFATSPLCCSAYAAPP